MHGNVLQYLTLGIVVGLLCICPSLADTTVNGVVYQWANWNNNGVLNGPPSEYTIFSVDETVQVTYLDCYHYNNGHGVSYPGTLTLVSNDGGRYGPFQMISSEKNNVIWNYVPYDGEIILPPGSYTVMDSDPDTWSNNAGSEYAGFFGIKWKKSNSKPASTPSTPSVSQPGTESDSHGYPIVMDYTTTSGVDSNSQPIDRKEIFSTSDDKAQFWVKIGPLYGGEAREFVFYSPNGDEFYRHTAKINDPADSGYEYWIDYYPSALIYIKGKDAAKLPGIWMVDFYLDGVLMASDDFSIESPSTSDTGIGITTPIEPLPPIREPPKILDYTTTSGVDSNTQPVDRKDTFSTQDKKVQFWVKIGQLYGGENREFIFYSPDGSEYYRAPGTVKDPADSGKERWDNYYLSSYIDILGAEAELHPGSWKVEMYVDGNLMASDQFTIESGGPFDIGNIIAGILPGNPKPEENDPETDQSTGMVNPDGDTEEVDVSFFAEYAYILNANNEFEKSYEVCNEGMKLNDGYPPLYGMRGWALFGLGKYD